MKRISPGVGLVLAFVQSAYAQKSTYDWQGDHACIVENSTGLRAFPPAGQSSSFRWANFDRSFFIQIRRCDKVTDSEWTFECEKKSIVLEGLKLSAKSRNDDLPAPWKSRLLTFPFTTALGETFNTDKEGHFVYALSGQTDKDELAVFMASGTCTPFQR